MLAANPTMGHSHPFKNDDSKPIPYQKVMENALGFTTEMRRASAVDTAPAIAAFMRSGGCGVNTSDKTTIDAYTSTTDFSLAAEGSVAGEAGLCELDNGLYWPVLVAANSGAANFNITPMNALPSATSNSNDWEVMTTIWPHFRQVETDRTLSFRRLTPMDYAGGTNEVAFDYKGCALGTGPVISITPAGEPIRVPMTFHCGTLEIEDIALAEEVFVDSEKFIITTDDLSVNIGTYADAGGIAYSPTCIYSIEIDTGFTTVPIIAGGCTSSFAGMQGYIMVPGVPTITITADWSVTDWQALESDQTPKEIAIVQPTRAITQPAMGFWGHNAVLRGDDAITEDYESNSYVTITSKYTLGAAGIDSDTLISEIGAAPWHWAISGEGA